MLSFSTMYLVLAKIKLHLLHMANVFAKKHAKIAKSSEHNIDPRIHFSLT
jgi:hypothetical protein